MTVDLTEQEVCMLRILMEICISDAVDDYGLEPEEKFVMEEILAKIGGRIDDFDLATSMDMGYFYEDIRKRMKERDEQD